MTSQEINEIIDKLEGLFDKMIQLKILENESRRLKIQESQGGKKFPSGGFIMSESDCPESNEFVISKADLETIRDAKKKNQETFQEIIQDRSNVSMFEFMGHVFNPNANAEMFGKDGEVLFDEAKKISEEFKNNWKCQE